MARNTIPNLRNSSQPLWVSYPKRGSKAWRATWMKVPKGISIPNCTYLAWAFARSWQCSSRAASLGTAFCGSLPQHRAHSHFATREFEEQRSDSRNHYGRVSASQYCCRGKTTWAHGCTRLSSNRCSQTPPRSNWMACWRVCSCCRKRCGWQETQIVVVKAGLVSAVKTGGDGKVPMLWLWMLGLLLL